MATRKSSKDGNRSNGNDDDSTNLGVALTQKSDGKVKGQRGAKKKFKKMFNFIPPTSPTSTPEPVRRLSSSNIGVTEDDKSEHQDIPHQTKWAVSVPRSSEHSESSPHNPSQISMTTLPPTHVRVTKDFRPVTQRSPDYNTLNDVVSL